MSAPGAVGFDFSSFSKLQSLEIGNCCFREMNIIRIAKLLYLERVIIGACSFDSITKSDITRAFYLKGCPSLKRLHLHSDSFLHYSVCEIENVNALEVIVMSGGCFSSA